MIEHLRKYTGLIIFVMALVFVGLTFLGKSSTRGGSDDPVRITIDGTSYSYSEYQKLGPSSVKLAQIMGTGMMYTFAMPLGVDFSSMDSPDQDRFVVNRVLLRKAANEFGIRPTDEEVAAAVKEQPVFQDKDGAFDQAKYNGLIQGYLGHLGLIEKDLFDLVRDDLVMKKLTSILGDGLAGSRQFAVDSVAAADQRLTLQVARLPLSKYEESLKPTDDELKVEWETAKQKYLTEKQLKVSYVLATPKYPEPAKEDAPLPATATEDEKKTAEVKKAAVATAEAEAKRKINKDLGAKVNVLLDGLDKNSGGTFEKLAAEAGFEIKSTDFFAISALPPEVDLKLRSAQGQATVASTLGNLSMEGSATNRFTNAIPIVDGQWLVVRADEIKEPRPKEFEEAKEEVRKDYVAKHASEALKKDADEKTAKIREGLTAGKSFADLTKEMDLEVKAHGPFGMQDRTAPDPDAGILFRPAATVDPGSLADPVLRPDAALLIFVEKREIVKDDTRAQKVERAVQSMANNQTTTAFVAWLQNRLETTKYTGPKK